ncbi:hypothetical protein [Oscillibacter sp.]|uniref:hypothetical protein n=1 Tax=Oscillibacter sp. TaxID=1945593 RepID=UPI0033976C69
MLYNGIMLAATVISAIVGIVALCKKNDNQTYVHESADIINNVSQNNYTYNQYVQNNNFAPSQSNSTSTSDGFWVLFLGVIVFIIIGSKLEPFLPFVLVLVAVCSVINIILLCIGMRSIIPAKRPWHSVLYLCIPAFYVAVYSLAMSWYETSLTALLASEESVLSVAAFCQASTIIALCVAGLAIVCIDMVFFLNALINWRKWHMPKVFKTLLNIWWLPLLIILLALFSMFIPLIVDYLNSTSVK